MDYFNKIKNSNVSIFKIVLVILISAYMFYYMATLSDWHFIDNVNLIFHEAGHPIFSFFGEFIHYFGGTLMQILIPAIFSFYFYNRKDYFSSSLLLFWLSQNFFNVYVYAADAIKMELPLLGGDGVNHDWNYMLSSVGLLKYTQQVSLFFYLVGIVILVYAIVFSFKFSTNSKSQF